MIFKIWWDLVWGIEYKQVCPLCGRNLWHGWQGKVLANPLLLRMMMRREAKFPEGLHNSRQQVTFPGLDANDVTCFHDIPYSWQFPNHRTIIILLIMGWLEDIFYVPRTVLFVRWLLAERIMVFWVWRFGVPSLFGSTSILVQWSSGVLKWYFKAVGCDSEQIDSSHASFPTLFTEVVRKDQSKHIIWPTSSKGR